MIAVTFNIVSLSREKPRTINPYLEPWRLQSGTDRKICAIVDSEAKKGGTVHWLLNVSKSRVILKILLSLS